MSVSVTQNFYTLPFILLILGSSVQIFLLFLPHCVSSLFSFTVFDNILLPWICMLTLAILLFYHLSDDGRGGEGQLLAWGFVYLLEYLSSTFSPVMCVTVLFQVPFTWGVRSWETAYSPWLHFRVSGGSLGYPECQNKKDFTRRHQIHTGHPSSSLSVCSLS